MRSSEFGVRSSECGVRSAECGVRSAESGVRSSEFGTPDHAVVLGGNANGILVTIGINDYSSFADDHGMTPESA